MEKPDKQGLVDRYLAKWMSRRLLVFCGTSGLLIAGTIDSSTWLAVALAYVGSQAMVDLAAKWKECK